MKDIKGRKFGLLTATTVVGKARDGSLIGKVIFDCGKEGEVNGVFLRNGSKQHCGCLNKHGNRFIDLTGKKIGHLTVIGIAGKAKDGSYIWNVFCDCNPNYSLPVNGGDLRRGRKTDCGCRHGNRAELLGEKFGNLLVVGFHYNPETKEFIWKCLCNCGEITTARTRDLTSGKKRSCGCLKSPNLVGKKFGRLTVIKKLNKKRNGYYLWKVLCDCGNTDEATTGHLMSGAKKSCGCLNHEIEDISGVKRNMLTAKRVADFRNTKGEVLWEFICDCGGVTYTTRDKFMSGHTKSCGCLKDFSLEKHHNWKNGVSSVSRFLRRSIKEWKQASLQSTNYKCYISNEEGDLVIHHANEHHPFYKIVQETFELTGLPIYPTIGQYTEEELTLLSKTCLDLHFKYGLGIPLKPQLHEEFHHTYGFTNWTNQDFNKFVEEKKKQLE
ncbi:hypothetical protein [Aeribacillus sp. FSL M8-0254]|mgnify:FL=1|uniref:hypothetical protein n=1 Tax=Aeribacillus sp. FSL M8-0254 TaxID=2954577 RepID=UPI0025A61482|nr:hypothetical protein QT234_08780 [Geobacillus stearothermophilus]